jgi:hypothetical protein
MAVKHAVACICVGDKYNLTDVKILEQMVFQNTTYDINFRVFDEPVLPKWWTKVLYHSPVIEPFEEEVVLAFDLDVVIKGSIDPLFDWVEQQDYLCAVWCRYNSSILGWKPDTCLKVWEEFVFEDIEKYNGFDTYLWMKRLDPIRIPDHFYYSAHFAQYQELNYPVAIFNKGQNIGLEKHEIISKVPWVKKYRN